MRIYRVYKEEWKIGYWSISQWRWRYILGRRWTGRTRTGLLKSTKILMPPSHPSVRPEIRMLITDLAGCRYRVLRDPRARPLFNQPGGGASATPLSNCNLFRTTSLSAPRWILQNIYFLLLRGFCQTTGFFWKLKLKLRQTYIIYINTKLYQILYHVNDKKWYDYNKKSYALPKDYYCLPSYILNSLKEI